MTGGQAVLVCAAGTVAGGINAVVGAGSLITFPTLLAVGYPPVLANVSNTVGLVPGSVSGAVGYRRELAGQGPRVAVLSIASGLGGVIGAVLLLQVPSAFERIVPWLILLACALVLVQPRLSRRLADRRSTRRGGGPLLFAGVLATGVYGGYFGAAQGVIQLALLAVGIDDDLQRLNGVKNVIAAVTNGLAGLVFVAVTHVAWLAAGLLAAGSVVGAQFGARLARRLSGRVLRILIVTVGVTVAVKLLLA
ncbi:MAG: sulfite exporter TauE/SafE family protein [Actinomycetota bacterium]|nr:sulfite exporter TauE/SafE family protein [Actinomycetota bacterium]